MQAMQQYIRTVSDNDNDNDGNGGDDRARKKSVPHAHIRARKKKRLHQLKKITDGKKLLECFVVFGGLKANRHNDIVAQ